MSELRRARKSLETVRRAKEMLGTFYRRQEGRREGAPLAWCMAGVSSELLYAFDLPWEWPENFGTLCAAKQVATRFCEQAEADGFSQDLCSYLRNNVGYVSRALELGATPPEAPGGGMGTPTMLLGSGSICDPHKLDLVDVRRYLEDAGLPSLVLEDDYTLTNLESMRTRIQAFVEMVA